MSDTEEEELKSQLVEKINKAAENSADEEETLKQYLRQNGDEFVVGLENLRKNRLRMKIVLEGLECRDFNRGKSEISFYILGKSKKTFSLWVKRGYYGDCTFLSHIYEILK